MNRENRLIDDKQLEAQIYHNKPHAQVDLDAYVLPRRGGWMLQTAHPDWRQD